MTGFVDRPARRFHGRECDADFPGGDTVGQIMPGADLRVVWLSRAPGKELNSSDDDRLSVVLGAPRP